MSSRPWLAAYDEGVPPTLAPYPPETLLAHVARAAREEPRAPAVLFKGSHLGWGELERDTDALAHALAARGVRPGDRVALLLPNCPQFLIAEMGAWKAGAVVVPLNPIYNEAELLGPLVDTGAETIVTLTPFYERVKTLQARSSLRRVIATRIREHLPPLLKLAFMLLRERREGHRVELRDGDEWLRDLVDEGRTAGAFAPRCAPEDAALILLSGGTTGRPKGVVARHGGLAITARQVRAWYGEVVREREDVFVLPLPLFHAFGCVGVQSVALAGRNPIALVPNPRDIDDVVGTIASVRPAVFVGVPTLFIAILGHPRVQAGRVDFRSIKLCLSGAAALMAETRRRFESLTGGSIVEAYSLSEAVLAAVANPLSGGKPGSVGLPLPDVEVRIADGETGEGTLPPGEVGEILIRAPQIMREYWNAPAETEDALRDHGDGGGRWLHTGDLGRFDEEGWLYVVDRKKDLIKPGGLQVWPREVEEAIASHPAVREAGVAGVQDPDRGEVVKAWVVLRPGHAASVDEIRAHCRERLAPYKVPREVEFRSDLPKTMIGKVLRRALREEHRAARPA